MSSRTAEWSLDPTRRWIVQVTLATQRTLIEQVLVRMDQVAEREFDGTVSARSGGPGLVLTVEVAGADVGEALGWASALARRIDGDDVHDGTASLVDLRVTTPEQYEAEAVRPDTDELAGVTEAAEILEVTRQRLTMLRQRPEFPAPLVTLAQGPVWGVTALRAYGRTRNRDPGRPRLRDAAAQ